MPFGTDVLTLETVLDDNDFRALFTKYLEETHNKELLLFVEAVECLALLKSSTNRYQRSKTIIQQFVKCGAKQELNINEELREAARKRFEEASEESCPATLFDDLLSIVMLQLKEDVFPRFLNSRSCLENVKALKRRDSSFVLPKSGPVTRDVAPLEQYDKNFFFATEEFLEQMKDWAFSDKIHSRIGWKEVQVKKDCTAYISKKGVKICDSRKLKMWKLVGTLPFSTESVLYAASAIDVRTENDGNIYKMLPIHYFSCDQSPTGYAATISVEFVQFNSLISNRYLVFSGTCIVERDPSTGFKRYIIARKTVNAPVAALSESDRKSMVKGDCVGAIIIEQANHENTLTRYYEVGWLDLKGSIPAWLWNMLVSTRGTTYHYGLIKGASQATPQKIANMNTNRLMDTLKEYQASHKFI